MLFCFAVPPERSKQPGTYGGIARMKISPRDKKIKGPKCGQCEMKAAHVVRNFCQEFYDNISQECHFATP